MLYQGMRQAGPSIRILSMRAINSIVIHCSATRAGMDFTAADIERWHRERGMNGIGYHYVIRLDGSVEKGRKVEMTGAHCIGYNQHSIGICYIGGLDARGNAADTRTTLQKAALKKLVKELMQTFPIRKVIGHGEVAAKACPCFDVKAWMKQAGIGLVEGMVLCAFLLSCSSKKEMARKVQRVDSLSVEYQKSAEADCRTYLDKLKELEEHVEQTVTTTVVHTVRDRRQKKEEKGGEEKHVTVKDSLAVVKREVMDCVEEKHQERGGKGKGHIWMIAGMGIGGIFFVGIMSKRKRTFSKV